MINGVYKLTKSKSKRIFYFDALRALAILSVINFHIFNGSTLNYVIPQFAAIPSFAWFVTDFMVNCGRLGVILFLMLSGALSLGRSWSIKTFLGRRIPRIVYPYAFWTAFFIIIALILSYFFGIPFVKSFDLKSILVFIYQTMFGLNGIGKHLWFFWMILGTYLIMPIFDKWAANCSLKEVEYFLCIWLVTCLFTFTLGKKFPVTLNYFTGAIGFVVLGYYLRHTERKILNNPYFDILLILVTCIVTIFISYSMSSSTELFKFNRYSIFMALNVMGVFLLFKNFHKFNLNMDFLTKPGRLLNRFTLLLARYSYGLYLVHLPLIKIALVFLKTFPLKVMLVELWIVGLFGSLILLYLFSKIPFMSDKVGVK